MLKRRLVFLFGCILNITSLFAETNEPQLHIENWRRSKLTITNATHIDEGGDGRSLYLEWRGDIEHPPQYTASIAPGDSDTKDSTLTDWTYGTRNFTVSVYRIKDNAVLHIGSFTHGITSAAGVGNSDTIRIFKNYTANHVQLWGETYRSDGGDGVIKIHFPIGAVPRSEW